MHRLLALNLAKLTALYPTDRLAQEADNLEELNRLTYLVVQGLDITQPNPNKLLTKVASLCYQVRNILNEIAEAYWSKLL